MAIDKSTRLTTLEDHDEFIRAELEASGEVVPEVFLSINLGGGVMQNIRFHGSVQTAARQMVDWLDAGEFGEEDGEMKLIRSNSNGEAEQIFALWSVDDAGQLRVLAETGELPGAGRAAVVL